jgi:hypothetical protein
MNDFESHLTTLLDDTAASIDTHPDLDAIFSGARVANLRTAQRAPFRPRLLAAAAAALVLVGGSAYAFGSGGDEAGQLVPAQDVAQDVTTPTEPDRTEAPKPTDPAVTEGPKTTAATKPVEPVESKPVESAPVVEAPPATAAPIAFTANLGGGALGASPMKQTFFGTGPIGSTVTASSGYGSAHAAVGEAGKWELTLKLVDVPGGATVPVRLSSSASDAYYDYALVRPMPEAPPTTAPQLVAFTANPGSNKMEILKHGFYGTAAPGSAIRVGSDYGVVETTANAKGKWEVMLVMQGALPGSEIGVRITASTSEQVYEFVLHVPEAPSVSYDFTASAAFESCDANPPYNEYWGKAAPGAVITISSPYGGATVTANGDGRWSARVEFPSAPVGETFAVQVASSQGGNVYSFPMTRTGPL